MVNCTEYAAPGGGRGGAPAAAPPWAPRPAPETRPGAYAREPAGGGEAMDEAGNVPGKLYVSKLHPDVTPQELSEVFGSFGACDCEVVTDRLSGVSRGFGFVRFVNPENMKIALKHPHYVRDVEVEVSPCWSKGKPGTRSAARYAPY